MTPLRAPAQRPQIRLPSIEDVDALPFAALPAVSLALTALQARVATRLAKVASDTADSSAEPEALLTINQAAALLAVTKDYLRRRPRLPFVVKLSEGTVRYSRRGILTFIEAHRVTSDRP